MERFPDARVSSSPRIGAISRWNRDDFPSAICLFNPIFWTKSYISEQVSSECVSTLGRSFSENGRFCDKIALGRRSDFMRNQKKAEMCVFPEAKYTFAPKRNFDSAQKWKCNFAPNWGMGIHIASLKVATKGQSRARRFRSANFLNIDLISEFSTFAAKWKCKFAPN